jgi:hypothetical protein
MKMEDLSPEDRKALQWYMTPYVRDKFGRVPKELRTCYCEKLQETVTFDSLGEMNHWNELVFREKVGDIRNLQRQVDFILVDDKKSGFKLTYRADYMYEERIGTTESFEVVVSDFKGQITRIYRKKKKLMLSVYGIKIKEVFSK